jgi:hypothetical protein
MAPSLLGLGWLARSENNLVSMEGFRRSARRWSGGRAGALLVAARINCLIGKDIASALG